MFYVSYSMGAIAVVVISWHCFLMVDLNLIMKLNLVVNLGLFCGLGSCELEPFCGPDISVLKD